MTIQPTHSILIVDDDQILRDTLCDVISDIISDMFHTEDCRILSADCGLQALQILQNEPCALMLSDIDMPDISGFELLARIRTQQIDVPCVFMSARSNQAMSDAATQAGALAMLSKPIDITHVQRIAHNVFHL